METKEPTKIKLAHSVIVPLYNVMSGTLMSFPTASKDIAIYEPGEMNVPLDRIPDSLGYLVLSEDGAVINSGGDLENDEELAPKLLQLIHSASRVPLSSNRRETFKKISVIWDTFMFVMTVSNHRIYVSKRKYIPVDAVNA